MIVGNITGGVFIYKQDLIVSSVEDIASASGGVEVYPNPANNVVYVSWEMEFPGTSAVSIVIYSITGQKQLEKRASANEHATEISTATLAPGIYMCEVTSGSSRKTARLIIVR
jgi:hypothetical protein